MRCLIAIGMEVCFYRILPLTGVVQSQPEVRDRGREALRSWHEQGRYSGIAACFSSAAHVSQTSSGLRVVIISADLRWTSASRSKFFGNLLRLA